MKSYNNTFHKSRYEEINTIDNDILYIFRNMRERKIKSDLSVFSYQKLVDDLIKNLKEDLSNDLNNELINYDR